MSRKYSTLLIHRAWISSHRSQVSQKIKKQKFVYVDITFITTLWPKPVLLIPGSILLAIVDILSHVATVIGNCKNIPYSGKTEYACACVCVCEVGAGDQALDITASLCLKLCVLATATSIRAQLWLSGWLSIMSLGAGKPCCV